MPDLIAARQAGLLLHITSLPGPEGIGSLGPDAHRFVDFLASTGFAAWQVLPVNPPGPGWSPYAAESSFAGSPLLVSVEALAADRLLAPSEAEPPTFGASHVDYEAAARWKQRALRAAFRRLDRSQRDEVDAFAAKAPWLDDWTLFAALSDRHGAPWQAWPEGLARREPSALATAREELAAEIAFHRFVQWAFDRQWRALHEHARASGVAIFGDVPIFPALHSSDVWAHQDTFKLLRTGYPAVVAGVPPDLFSASGQRWGNPHYRWDVERERGFPYWTSRLRRAFELYDILRIDHFRGFEAAWEVPAESPTAINGRWVPGPSAALFDALREHLGELHIVVEDLGVITPDVVALRERLGYPGLLVLQFAFDGMPDNPYLPANHPRNAVVYPGTHDNDTTAGWWHSLTPEQRGLVRRATGRPFTDPAWELSQVALESPANLAILVMQDLLRLGSEARMNTPGRAEGNWAWRFAWSQLMEGLSAVVSQAIADSGRKRTQP